jgi:hypothetical protein
VHAACRFFRNLGCLPFVESYESDSPSAQGHSPANVPSQSAQSSVKKCCRQRIRLCTRQGAISAICRKGIATHLLRAPVSHVSFANLSPVRTPLPKGVETSYLAVLTQRLYKTLLWGPCARTNPQANSFLTGADLTAAHHTAIHRARAPLKAGYWTLKLIQK